DLGQELDLDGAERSFNCGRICKFLSVGGSKADAVPETDDFLVEGVNGFAGRGFVGRLLRLGRRIVAAAGPFGEGLMQAIAGCLLLGGLDLASARAGLVCRLLARLVRASDQAESDQPSRHDRSPIDAAFCPLCHELLLANLCPPARGRDPSLAWEEGQDGEDRTVPRSSRAVKISKN